MSRLEWGQVTIPTLYVVLAAIALYFVHSGMQGGHGLNALKDAERSRVALEAELRMLEAEQADMANRVARMGPEEFDLDLLDEQAREVLGYVRTDELVIR